LWEDVVLLLMEENLGEGSEWSFEKKRKEIQKRSETLQTLFEQRKRTSSSWLASFGQYKIGDNRALWQDPEKRRSVCSREMLSSSAPTLLISSPQNEDVPIHKSSALDRLSSVEDSSYPYEETEKVTEDLEKTVTVPIKEDEKKEEPEEHKLTPEQPKREIDDDSSGSEGIEEEEYSPIKRKADEVAPLEIGWAGSLNFPEV